MNSNNTSQPVLRIRLKAVNLFYKTTLYFIFHQPERIFHGLERIFHGLKYKTYYAYKPILSMIVEKIGLWKYEWDTETRRHSVLFFWPLWACLNFAQVNFANCFRECFSDFMKRIAGYLTNKIGKTDRKQTQKNLIEYYFIGKFKQALYLFLRVSAPLCSV